MKRFSTLSRHVDPLASATVGLAAIAASLSLSCVSAGAHRELTDERDRLASESQALARKVELLESATGSLDGERVDALEQVEDLRVERERLETEVARLRESEQELSLTRAELEARNAEVQRLRGTYDGLVEDLEAEVARGQIEIQQLREGLQLNVSQEILFPSGSAQLNPSGQDVLRKVASRLAELPHRVEVRGHSDNLRISGGLAERYPTNWELAGARAARVVRLLEGNGVNGERLSAVSRAEFEPIEDNQTPDGRRANRRIEIRLHPSRSADVQPPAPDAGPAPESGTEPTPEAGDGA